MSSKDILIKRLRLASDAETQRLISTYQFLPCVRCENRSWIDVLGSNTKRLKCKCLHTTSQYSPDTSLGGGLYCNPADLVCIDFKRAW